MGSHFQAPSVSRCAPLARWVLAGIALWTSPASAQETGTQNAEPPAAIVVVDRSATLERDGQEQPAVANLPVIAGDRLRTQSGRVEILFPDGSVLDVDEQTSIDFQAPTLVRLAAGQVRLFVAGAGDPRQITRYDIDTPAASISIERAGEYRIAVSSRGQPLVERDPFAETELIVFRGEAALTTERGTASVRAGERSAARVDDLPQTPRRFNSARFDAFDRWSAEQQNARVGSASAAFLPSNLQMYSGTFDQYGTWQQDPSYGYVWYPTIAVGWRPYHHGFWSAVGPYGWTWIGADRWSWPTHHYGRWGHARGSWFWIPGRTWSAAWVSWGAAPGYVSWCPLGYDNRPVFGWSNAGHSSNGWTTVPRHTFGSHHYYANRHAVHPRDLPASTPFVVQNRPPVAPGRAVARRTAGMAVPRRGNAAASQQPSAVGSPTVVSTPPDVIGRTPDVVSPRPNVISPRPEVASPWPPATRWPTAERQTQRPDPPPPPAYGRRNPGDRSTDSPSSIPFGGIGVAVPRMTLPPPAASPPIASPPAASPPPAAPSLPSAPMRAAPPAVPRAPAPTPAALPPAAPAPSAPAASTAPAPAAPARGASSHAASSGSSGGQARSR